MRPASTTRAILPRKGLDWNATNTNLKRRSKMKMRIQQLLVHAPIDRTWCRRDMLVLCRAFRDKTTLRLADNRVVGGGIEHACSRAIRSCKTGEINVDNYHTSAAGEEEMVTASILVA